MYVIRFESPVGDAYAANTRHGLSLDVGPAVKFGGGGDAGCWLDSKAGKLPGCEHVVAPFEWPEEIAFLRACHAVTSIPCPYPRGARDADGDVARVHQPDVVRRPVGPGGHDAEGVPARPANGHPGRVA